MKRGIWYAIGAYIIWGVLPVYWRWLHHVPALQLLAHRILWSLVCLGLVLWHGQRWRRLQTKLHSRRVLVLSSLAAVLIGVNWLTYVWAVNAERIVETSLGYFINPLISVVFGVVVFRERLRVAQWLAIGLAASGVLYLTFIYGAFPWVSLTLAFSFALYGVVKKITPLGPLEGLTAETAVLLVPAIGVLGIAEANGSGALLHSGALSDLLLIGAGPVTTIPLLLFAAAAPRIPLALVGMLQYIAPTLQLLLGVLMYGEPFGRARVIGFGLVWAALGIFAAEQIVRSQTRPPLVPDAA